MDKGYRELLRTGIGYNINNIQKGMPEIYEKYKLMFLMLPDDEEIVYQNELYNYVSRETSHQFFLDMHPELQAVAEGRITQEEYLEHIRKTVKITATEYPSD